MSEQLPLPPHIKQAKAALTEAGIPEAAMPHCVSALHLAANFYHATTQVSRTDKMKRERDQTQDELEQVSSDLQAARKELRALRDQVNGWPELRAEIQREAQATADKQTGRFMSAASRLREIFFEVANILNGKELDPNKKVQSAKGALARALSTSSNRKHSMLGKWLLTNEMPDDSQAEQPTPPTP